MDQEDTMLMLDELTVAKDNLVERKDQSERQLSEKVNRLNEIKDRMALQEKQINALSAKADNAEEDVATHQSTINLLQATVHELTVAVRCIFCILCDALCGWPRRWLPPIFFLLSPSCIHMSCWYSDTYANGIHLVDVRTITLQMEQRVHELDEASSQLDNQRTENSELVEKCAKYVSEIADVRADASALDANIKELNDQVCSRRLII